MVGSQKAKSPLSRQICIGLTFLLVGSVGTHLPMFWIQKDFPLVQQEDIVLST